MCNGEGLVCEVENVVGGRLGFCVLRLGCVYFFPSQRINTHGVFTEPSVHSKSPKKCVAMIEAALLDPCLVCSALWVTLLVTTYNEFQLKAMKVWQRPGTNEGIRQAIVHQQIGNLSL